MIKKLPGFLASLVGVAMLVSGCATLPEIATVSSTPIFPPTFPATLTLTATPPPTDTPAPTATTTPLPLPSLDELNARFKNQVKPLLDQLMAATEDPNITLAPDVQILYVPQNSRLYYVQSILLPTGTLSSVPAKTAYVLYDYTRGATLGHRVSYSTSITTETQEVSTNLRLIVQKNGKYYLVERKKATAGKGETTLTNLITNAVQPFEKLSGSNPQVETNLEEIIGYAGGIDMDPSLDYQRKVALLTFALRSDSWAERRQAAAGLGTLDPLPVESAPDLIANLGKDEMDIFAADDILSKMAGNPQVFDLLLKAFSDPNARVRENAATVLSRLPSRPDTLLEPYVTLLHDQDIMVRQVARGWLSGYNKPSVIAPMIAAFQDKNPDVRQAAAEVLLSYGPQAVAAIPNLAALLQDTSPGVREAAANALSAIGSQAKSALPDLAKAAPLETDQNAFEAEVHSIASLSSKADALPILQQALSTNQRETRLAAIAILANYQGVPGAVQALESVFTDKDANIRQNAISSIGGFGAEARSAMPTLIQVAQKESDYNVFGVEIKAIASLSSQADTLPLLKQALAGKGDNRYAACNILASYKDVPGVVEVLTPYLNDKDEGLRNCVVKALSGISNQAGVSLPQLIKAAQNETDPDAFSSEIASIVSLSDKVTALPVLQQALASKQVKIRLAACEILGDYRGIAGAVEVLDSVLKDQDAYVRQMAAQRLVWFGDEGKSSLPDLIAAAQKETNGEAFNAEVDAIASFSSRAEAFPLVKQAVTSKQQDIRRAASYSLGNFKGVPGTVDLCISLLGSPDDTLRAGAAASLGGFGAEAKSAVPALTAKLGDPSDYYVYINSAISLGQIGPDASPAVPALIKMLQSTDDFNQRYPLYALGGIGPAARQAVPVLMNLLNTIKPGNWSAELTKDCFNDLTAITQEDFGSDAQKWNDWWALNKNNW